MNRYPAIALLEFASIASGIQSGDAMVKRAPISVLKSGTVHNGKYLVLIGGSVASVEEAFNQGLATGGGQVIDHVMLPDVHNQVHDAVLGTRSNCDSDAIGIIETATVASTIRAADAGIKGADVNIIEIRLADDIGGKAFFILAGSVEDVEAAIEISHSTVTHPDVWLHHTLIPRLHEEMASQIDQSTQFAKVPLDQLADGEVS